MTEGVDYAWARPDPAKLAAAGKRFAVRYVGAVPTGKQLDAAEARALIAAGVAIVCNVEGSADGLAGGYDVGQDWAATAHNHAVRCGMPPGRPIYLSCDFDVGPARWPAVREALRGAAAVLGPSRVGIYGSYQAIAWAVRDGAAAWYWQTAGWSDGRWHPAAHIRQYRNGVALAGGTVDLDRAMVRDVGQWGVPVITDDDLQDIAAACAAAVWAKEINSPKLGRQVPAADWLKDGWVARAATAGLTARLDTILAAALDDANVTVTLAPDQLGELQAIRDQLAAAVAALPDLVDDQLDRRLTAAAEAD